MRMIMKKRVVRRTKTDKRRLLKGLIMKITRSTFDEVMFPCYNPMNMVIKKAHGAYVFDNQGNKYVDFTSGIAVNCLGHTPNGVQKVIKKTIKQYYK